MNQINEDHFSDELLFCIKSSDVIKAKALLQYFPDLDLRHQKAVLYHLIKASVDVSYPLLDYLYAIDLLTIEIKDEIYTLLLDVSFGEPDLLISKLSDKSILNRELYIKIAGDLQQESAVSALHAILNTEIDIPVIKQSIKSLGIISSPESVSPIAEFLYYGDRELEEEAIYALKQIGNSEAISRLAEAIRPGNGTNSLLFDVLSAVQNQFCLEKLCNLLTSKEVDIRNMAIDHIIQIGSKIVPFLVENLKTEDIDLLVHTLTILGKIGDPSAIPPIQKLLYNRHKDSNVRFAAYEALGRLPSTRTAISLAIGLEDEDDQVRMAAAKAIDTNLSNVLMAGLKNLIEPSDEQAKGIVATLLDAEADNVFNKMIEWDVFAGISSIYLAQKAPPHIRDHYQVLLMGKGNKSLANLIQNAAEGIAKDTRLTIFAVDDSKMLLNLYLKKLHKMGHEAQTFQFPAKAIDAILETKPDLVITDLNMPDINGVQLTKTLREKYDSAQLPIIMITTQSDFVDTEEIKAIGVNRVLHKPFKDEELAATIEELTINAS